MGPFPREIFQYLTFEFRNGQKWKSGRLHFTYSEMPWPWFHIIYCNNLLLMRLDNGWCFLRIQDKIRDMHQNENESFKLFDII